MAAPLRQAPFPMGPPGRSWRPGLSIWTAPLPGLPGWYRRFLCRLILFVFGPLIEVEGAERLEPFEGPAIFACNHGNSVEAILVPTLLAYLRGGERVHFLADWMFVHLPPFGWLLRLGGSVPVYRKRARWGLRDGLRRERAQRSALTVSTGLLAEGKSVGIFPEGTRNQDPERLLRGRSGVGALALRSGAPVVPIGLRYPAAARLGRPPRVGRLCLSIGTPLRFSAGDAELSPSSLPSERWAPRRATEQIMTALARLSGKRETSRRPEVP